MGPKLIDIPALQKTSRKEFFKPVNEHFHHVLALKKLNVCSSTDKGVQVCFFDAEVNVNPVQNI